MSSSNPPYPYYNGITYNSAFFNTTKTTQSSTSALPNPYYLPTTYTQLGWKSANLHPTNFITANKDIFYAFQIPFPCSGVWYVAFTSQTTSTGTYYTASFPTTYNGIGLNTENWVSLIAPSINTYGTPTIALFCTLAVSTSYYNLLLQAGTDLAQWTSVSINITRIG